MLLDSNKVEQFLDTKGKGAKAQVGYDLTLKGVKQINGGVVLKDKTELEDYVDVMPTFTSNEKFLFSALKIGLELFFLLLPCACFLDFLTFLLDLLLECSSKLFDLSLSFSYSENSSLEDSCLAFLRMILLGSIG